MTCSNEVAWLCASISVVLALVALVKHEAGRRAAPGGVVQRVRLQTTLRPLPPLAPLRWDEQEGAYMIALQIGDGLVELVLDTGSSNISAKGENCKWTMCSGSDGMSGDKCVTKSCPCGTDESGQPRKDCDGYTYRPRGRFLRPGEKGAHTNSKLTYGSQEDTVEHYLDTVRISLAPDNVTCDTVAMQLPSAVSFAGGASAAVTRDNVLVHRVTHTKGTSTSNLFGLAQPGKSGPVVLNTLYPDRSTPMVWSVILRPSAGWWALGSLPCFTDTLYMPLVDPHAFDQFVTRFYVVNLVYVETGPTLDTMRRVSSGKTPKYCVIDTGTTYTYTAPYFGAAMDRLGYDERTWYVRLALGDSNKPVVLTYNADVLRDPEQPNASVLQITEGRTLDNFNQLFPNVDLMLLGAVMMQHCYWEFDVTQKRVGVQTLPDA